MTFQMRTLTIAIWILIISLGLIAVLLMVGKGKQDFPPEIGTCPDYWQLLEDGTCHNIKALGTGCPGSINFNVDEYKGDKGKIAKCKLIKSCNATWDGITNVGLC